MNNLPQQSPSVQDPANYEPSKFERERIATQIERYGHVGFYEYHFCQTCKKNWDCNTHRCHKPEESECKACFASELHEDVRRICTQIVIQRSVTTEQLGWLKGLAERAQELERWS